jgi:hypothetical protein
VWTVLDGEQVIGTVRALPAGERGVIYALDVPGETETEVVPTADCDESASRALVQPVTLDDAGPVRWTTSTMRAEERLMHGRSRRYKRAVVADQAREGAGIIATVSTVPNLVAALHEPDLSVRLAQPVDHVPAARGRLTGRQDGVPVGQFVCSS